MTNLGDISHYLGIQVNYVIGKKITFCQGTYLKKVLNCLKMTECKPATVMINFEVTNFLLFYNRNADQTTIKQYQLAIGSLMWLAVYTCPDIAYSVEILSYYYSNLGPAHCNLVIQIFRYLFRTLELKITFIADLENNLVGYKDFNYAKLIDG